MTCPTRHLRLLVPLVLASVLPLAACSGSDDDETVVHVLAAASLTEVFTELEAEFEKEHQDVDVQLSFGSSTTLAENAVDGAPGDVLATADADSMQVAEDGQVASDPTRFATNSLVLVVPSDNPEGIESLADVQGTDWVRCADDVPCGRVAQAVLGANDFSDEAASLEVDVKAVLSKVTTGEADAGFVYATDAEAAGDDVIAIDVPGSDQELNEYFVAELDQSGHPDLAREWLELIESDHGQQVLTEAKFGTP